MQSPNIKALEDACVDLGLTTDMGSLIKQKLFNIKICPIVYRSGGENT
jgi:hypothetical protein